ncbi:class I SAM-dependent methyltransferase [Roseateles sp. BYS180W]|uniref:Class I SAM-dependent methyltransferase n=1 Tax=Roseateles rivi TaxID=3299028 RepID=A0ABW7FYA4_9BURK
MAHIQQFFFVNGVKQFLPQHFQGKKVLEIGSLNLNGSVRQFFTDCDYLGLDVGPGRDVDLVCHGENHGATAESYDVIISCEAMEHNPAWRTTWLNMLRMLKPDGLMIMTCATHGRRQHGTAEFQPGDSPLTVGMSQNYYRNLAAEDFSALCPPTAWFSEHAFNTDYESHDLYFFGVGLGASAQVRHQGAELKASLAKHYHDKNVLGRY